MRSQQIVMMTLISAWICLPLSLGIPTAGAVDVDPPGYVEYPVPLSLFVASPLRAPCSLLEQGRLSSAFVAFQDYLHQHPDDLPAVVGLVQSDTTDRSRRLAKYEADTTENHSPTNSLKLGLTALYLLGSSPYGTVPGMNLTRQDLVKLTRSNLEYAYAQSHAPVAGFILARSFFYTGGDALAVYEEMLRRMGGTNVYQAYRQAKASGWDAPQPPVPSLSRHDLLIFRRVVGGIWSLYGIRHGRVIERLANGVPSYQTVMSPLTSSHVKAVDFLNEWRLRIQEAADRLSTASVSP